GRLAAVLAIENGSALGGDVDHLDAVYQRGVRMMSLTWNSSNGLADGAMESRHGGLTPLGRQVLTRMQQLGMIVDVSHLSAKSFGMSWRRHRGPLWPRTQTRPRSLRTRATWMMSSCARWHGAEASRGSTSTPRSPAGRRWHASSITSRT